MTDRPIIMSAPMVRAILARRKTETRRLIKPQPPTPEQFFGSSFGLSRCVADGIKMYSQNDHERLPKHPTDWELCGSVGVARDAGFPDRYRVRYAVGDRLWVREAWRIDGAGSGVSADACRGKRAVQYRADGYDARIWEERSPIHMPRWASRITLAVTEVSVERLQEITTEGAIAEGCPGYHDEAKGGFWIDPFEQYAALWDSLQGDGAWNANPWVAVIRFAPTLANIDARDA